MQLDSPVFAVGKMYAYDYCTPGQGYSTEVEAERQRIWKLTRCLRDMATRVSEGKWPSFSSDQETVKFVTGNAPDLKHTPNPKIHLGKGEMRYFSASKFGAIGPAPPALVSDSPMRRQYFVFNENCVWDCSEKDIAAWLDQGYYVKHFRCKSYNPNTKKMRANVRFADSWIDKEFITEHKAKLYDD